MKQTSGLTKTIIGFSLMSFAHTFGSVMYGMFMQYLTDYSGIDATVGIIGFAATFGTVILLLPRIIDGVDDPIQAFIMDSGKETKFGKYRKYTILGDRKSVV